MKIILLFLIASTISFSAQSEQGGAWSLSNPSGSEVEGSIKTQDQLDMLITEKDRNWKVLKGEMFAPTLHLVLKGELNMMTTYEQLKKQYGFFQEPHDFVTAIFTGGVMTMYEYSSRVDTRARITDETRVKFRDATAEQINSELNTTIEGRTFLDLFGKVSYLTVNPESGLIAGVHTMNWKFYVKQNGDLSRGVKALHNRADNEFYNFILKINFLNNTELSN
ncbi:MAG: hypothetical protein CL677_06020 [Bdellovibrionaceae bacterium]|nr:hypothetical protein [Pseudobdellovibrionaceae bacterium]|tara:strand:+ start:153713 stop:154378 length:666 start_codon:yes stop_codon:yes gene_type:complete